MLSPAAAAAPLPAMRSVLTSAVGALALGTVILGSVESGPLVGVLTVGAVGAVAAVGVVAAVGAVYTRVWAADGGGVMWAVSARATVETAAFEQIVVTACTSAETVEAPETTKPARQLVRGAHLAVKP